MIACVQFPGARPPLTPPGGGSKNVEAPRVGGAEAWGSPEGCVGEDPAGCWLDTIGPPLPRACEANWLGLALPWLTCRVEKDSEAVPKFCLHHPLSLPRTWWEAVGSVLSCSHVFAVGVWFLLCGQETWGGNPEAGLSERLHTALREGPHPFEKCKLLRRV